MTNEIERVQRILWEEWDPIGVNGTGCPNDEYDGYALRIVELLEQGKKQADIAEYLLWAETENMGLRGSGRHYDVAGKIVKTHERK